MTDAALRLIHTLRLEPLPHEGGWFRQTWRGDNGSAILFLVTRHGFSALHRMAQDEVWCFHAGDAVEHVQLAAGRAAVTRLGPAPTHGDAVQLVVPRGTWQGAHLAADATQGFALVSCVVTPPWDDRGFELGARDQLAREFPSAAAWIAALTR